LALLPGNKLLCHFLTDFLLFDLDDTPKTTLDPSQYRQHLTATNPVAQVSLAAYAVSQPHFLRDSTRISVLTTHGARGVVIPLSNGISRGAIERINLFSTPFIDTQYACIGYDHAVICSWPELITLQDAWPGDRVCGLVVRKPIDQTTCEGPGEGRKPNLLFDESSGCIVLSVRETKKPLVLGIGRL
jgi:hypothetical protein